MQACAKCTQKTSVLLSRGRTTTLKPTRVSTRAMVPLDYPAPTIIEPASSSCSAALIYLHGLGDSANGWVDPQSGKAWAGTGINTREDTTGLRESQRYIEELVQAQVDSGIPSDRIMVGGFSQGGAVSLLMLRSRMKLAGVLGMSTYLPLWQEEIIVSEENKRTPILICHGEDDQGVLFKYGQQTAEQLKTLGTNIEFKSYKGMGHTTCDAEVNDMREFIAKCLPPQ